MRGLQEDLRVELLHPTRLAFAKEFEPALHNDVDSDGERVTPNRRVSRRDAIQTSING